MAPRTRTTPTGRSRRSGSGRRAAEPRRSALDRYLLDSEELVFAVRRHAAVLAGPVVVYLLVLAVAFLLLVFADGVSAVANTGLVVLLVGSLWFGWKVGDWHVERFTVTDRRVLLVSGLLTRRVAIMPLRKVTDLTFERSFAGRLCGYGAFVMESAGQQQALSRVDFLPRPEALYLQMSDLLFGRGGADHDPDEDGPAVARGRSPRRSRAATRAAAPPRTPPGTTERWSQPLPDPSDLPTGPRVTSRPPLAPPPPAAATTRYVPPVPAPPSAAATTRYPAPPAVPPPPSATTPLPRIAGERPLARRPRGRRGPDPTGDEPSGPAR